MVLDCVIVLALVMILACVIVLLHVMVLPHVMVLARGGAPSRNIFLEIKMDLFHATNIPRLLLDMAQGWPPRGTSIERSALPIQVPP